MSSWGVPTPEKLKTDQIPVMSGLADLKKRVEGQFGVVYEYLKTVDDSLTALSREQVKDKEATLASIQAAQEVLLSNLARQAQDSANLKTWLEEWRELQVKHDKATNEWANNQFQALIKVLDVKKDEILQHINAINAQNVSELSEWRLSQERDLSFLRDNLFSILARSFWSLIVRAMNRLWRHGQHK